MMATQTRFKLGGFINLPSFFNAFQSNVFYKNMGGGDGNAAHPIGVHGGVKQGNRTAIAVAIEVGPFMLQIQCLQQVWQIMAGFLVQVFVGTNIVRMAWGTVAIPITTVDQATTL